MINLYDSRLSGNGWKVRLLLNQLQIPYARHILNLTEGEARTPEFLRLNPLARIPVLVLEDGTAIRESNAILMFLAQHTPYLPAAPLDCTRVLQWLFFEQFDHLRYFARPRYLVSVLKAADKFADELAYLRQYGQKALVALDAQLAQTPYLAGSAYSIADIALFPYTSMAELGGYELEPFPAVQAWLERVRAQPGFIPLLDE
jgi:glutathione S-transferase